MVLQQAWERRTAGIIDGLRVRFHIDHHIVWVQTDHTLASYW